MLERIWMWLRGYRLMVQPRIKFENQKITMKEPAWVKMTKTGVHIIEWKGGKK